VSNKMKNEAQHHCGHTKNEGKGCAKDIVRRRGSEKKGPGRGKRAKKPKPKMVKKVVHREPRDKKKKGNPVKGFLPLEDLKIWSSKRGWLLKSRERKSAAAPVVGGTNTLRSEQSRTGRRSRETLIKRRKEERLQSTNRERDGNDKHPSGGGKKERNRES